MDANAVRQVSANVLGLRPSAPQSNLPKRGESQSVESDDKVARRRPAVEQSRLLGSESPAASMRRTYARFIVDQESSDVSVQIINADTNEVIRQIPSVELADLARMDLARRGLLVNNRA